MRLSQICSILLFFVFLFYASSLSAQVETQYWPRRSVDAGIGLGSVIAIVASWSRNQSVLWAIMHGILSWFYVIYFVLTRD